MPKSFASGRIVYSTDRGPLGEKSPGGAAGPSGASDPRDGVVRVRRETGGRGGKTVTTVTGAPGDEAAHRALSAEIKKSCGTGGAVKDGVIEIQGDHRDAVERLLAARGWRVKRAGG